MPNQPSKFREKNWFERNDHARGTYKTNIQTNFKTSMLKASVSAYSDANILVKGTKSISPVAPPIVII